MEPSMNGPLIFTNVYGKKKKKKNIKSFPNPYSPNAVTVAPYFSCNMEFSIWNLQTVIYQKHFKCNIQINKLGM